MAWAWLSNPLDSGYTHGTFKRRSLLPELQSADELSGKLCVPTPKGHHTHAVHQAMTSYDQAHGQSNAQHTRILQHTQHGSDELRDAATGQNPI